MSITVSKLIFSSFEALLYLLCIIYIIPRKNRVSLKYVLIQLVIITLSAYYFLNDNLYSILLFHCIIIFIVFLINKVDVYVASTTTIITFIINLVASLLSIIFAIFIYTTKYDFRFVLTGSDYKVFLLKFIITIICIYTYKLFSYLFNKKVRIQKLNPRPVIIVNVIYIVVLIYFSCELIEYLPSIFTEVLKIKSLATLVSTGISTAYIATGFMLYIINIYLFKSSDYISIKLSSETDAMTGVLNREAGLNYLQERMKNIQKKKGMLTICFIDVNNLKTINDRYGHKEGDRLINSVARLIKKELRDNDDIARLGGDEFLVIFDKCLINQGIKAWERILDKIDIYNLNSNLEYDISVSVGFTEYTHKMNISHELLIEIADAEMYKNKERYKMLKGKNSNGGW